MQFSKIKVFMQICRAISQKIPTFGYEGMPDMSAGINGFIQGDTAATMQPPNSEEGSQNCKQDIKDT